MHNYFKFKIHLKPKIEALNDYWVVDFKNLFRRPIKIRSQWVSSNILSIEEKIDFRINIEGGKSSKKL